MSGIQTSSQVEALCQRGIALKEIDQAAGVQRDSHFHLSGSIWRCADRILSKAGSGAHRPTRSEKSARHLCPPVAMVSSSECHGWCTEWIVTAASCLHDSAVCRQPAPDYLDVPVSLARRTLASSSFLLILASSPGSMSDWVSVSASFTEACHWVIASLIFPSLR